MMRQIGLFAGMTCLLLACLLTNPAVGQDADFQELVRFGPADANAIVLINVKAILDSPYGKREKLREEHQAAFARSGVGLPPGTAQFVLTSRINFLTMDAVWEAAVLRSELPVEMQRVAARLGVTLDEVQGMPVVALPNNALLTQFSPRILSAMSPANRQSLARWIGEIRGGRSSPPAYLQQATQYTDLGGTEVIMAMDLEYVITEGMARTALENAEWIDQAKADIDALVHVLMGVQGVSLGVTVHERMYGKIKVDFKDDVAPIGNLGKQMLLTAVQNQGLMIDDLESWTAKASGKMVTLEGELSRDGMRDILSLLHSPTAPFHEELRVAGSQDQAAPQSPGDQRVEVIKASQAYYQNVVATTEQMERKRKDAKTIGVYASWFEKYAKKIDSLPILNVDPDLLNFGAGVAQDMRQAGSILRGTGMAYTAAERQVQTAAPDVYGAYNVWGGGAYYYDYSSADRRVGQQRAAIRTQYRTQGYSQVQQITQKISNDTAEIRRVMTDRYQANF
jgi:hypothetical protein